MNRVQKIESEVQSLSVSEFKQLRDWIDDYEHKMWDKQLEQDIQAGKLDTLADEALSQFDAGKYKEI